MIDLSNLAWLTLGQLAHGSVWDGDLISKEGRTELIQAGLAQRDRKNDHSLMLNELTASGKELARNLALESGRA